ncbi:dihydropteroate synthase [Caproiciproducens sp. MSJ-32]|uniref:dihydropteroate synthase n=1 Tax=Caproiciproducens sp. MSJ-32 TaxID=2841527 RepID=UPI001C104E0C|nr:dihydropteroate synthase [Caproiciproducens sp. MSJ-32]MBU5454411.1 dihydropteroate synthase [Caproiciproducens sp. MSJ-32]
MKIGNKILDFNKRTYIMGILNVTPDSFSDGGMYNNIEAALKRAKEMVEEGADIIDVGGESTRPGASYVEAEEEIKRVVPIIKAIKRELDVLISIDTYKSQVAEEAIKAGADIVNDVWGLKKDKNMASIIVKYDVPCILMHNRDERPYNDLMRDLLDDLYESISLAKNAGIKADKIILDPGIGFAKTYEENLEVMNNLEKIVSLGYPVLLAASRKRMIGYALDLPVEERLEGTLATTVIGIMKGCHMVRVHDVLENKRVALMTDKIIKR